MEKRHGSPAARISGSRQRRRDRKVFVVGGVAAVMGV
jgi:hypothetical protein